MTTTPLRVLSHARSTLASRIAAAVPGVEVIAIPTDGPLPAGASGEVLLTLNRAAATLPDVLARGVRWVHILGTGVDGFPLDLLSHQTLTCSRGGSAVPIAEWVLAVMLAFGWLLTDSWGRAAPADWWRSGLLVTRHGRTLALVGLDGIGTAVAERARPFGMPVRACRRTTAPATVDGIEIVASLTDPVAT